MSCELNALLVYLVFEKLLLWLSKATGDPIIRCVEIYKRLELSKRTGVTQT